MKTLPCRCLKYSPIFSGFLASHRNPESYVAGSTPLTREASRYSSDIDVFHDREERVAKPHKDSALLQNTAIR